MQNRPEGFLDEQHIDHDGEIFHYIVELHEYLWRFVRCVNPGAGGNLAWHIDQAIDQLERERAARLPTGIVEIARWIVDQWERGNIIVHAPTQIGLVELRKWLQSDLLKNEE